MGTGLKAVSAPALLATRIASSKPISLMGDFILIEFQTGNYPPETCGQ
jgi:hypothetical protein